MKKNIIKSMTLFLILIATLASVLALVTNLPKPTLPTLSKEEMAEIEKEIAKNTTPIYLDGQIVGYKYRTTIWKFPKDDPSLSIESWTTIHLGEKDEYGYKSTNSSIGFNFTILDKSKHARRLQ